MVPLALIAVATLEVESAVAVLLVSLPHTFVPASLLVVVEALAVPEVVLPLPVVAVPVQVKEGANALLFVFKEIALVSVSILEVINSFPMLLVIFPQTFVSAS